MKGKWQGMAGKQTRRTWLSTNMAMSTNMSCSSLMLLSRRTMSLCLDSISLRACLEMPESTICVWRPGEVSYGHATGAPLGWSKPDALRTPAVKTAAFPLSNISSSSSSVVAFPAERESGFKSGEDWRSVHTTTRTCMWEALTDLQLSLDTAFTPLPEVHLGFVILSHDLHKLPGQHSMLEQGQKKKRTLPQKRVTTILKQDPPGLRVALRTYTEDIIYLRLAYPHVSRHPLLLL